MCYARVQNFTKTADKFVTCNQVPAFRQKRDLSELASIRDSYILCEHSSVYGGQDHIGASCPAISPYMILVF